MSLQSSCLGNTLQCSPAHLEGICSHPKWPHCCGTSGRISRSAGQPQAELCPQQLLQAGWGRTYPALFVLAWGWKQRAKGTSPSHLVSQTLLLAAWCQQDLETLPELIFALLSLAILVIFCLKGRVHLIMTEG